MGSIASSESSGNVNVTFDRGQTTTGSNLVRLSSSDRAQLQGSGLARPNSPALVVPTVAARNNDEENEQQSSHGSVDGDQHDNDSRN